MGVKRGLIAWADAEHTEVLRDVCDEGGLELVAVGSPDGGAGTALARQLGVDRLDDIREAGRVSEAEVLFLAAAEPLEAAGRRAVRESGLLAVANAPVPASIGELRVDPAEATTAEFTPLMRRSPGLLAARDLLAELGEIRCMSIVFTGGAGHGPLLSRLLDAMDMLECDGGTVETVDASLISPLGSVPETLRGLRGAMALSLRFAERRCATIAVADTNGAWSRSVTFLAEAGSLCVSDDGYMWLGRDGCRDVHREIRSLRPGHLIGAQIARALERRDHGPPPDLARLLALCEAARLSARTGQGEAPSRILEMSTHL